MCSSGSLVWNVRYRNFVTCSTEYEHQQERDEHYLLAERPLVDHVGIVRSVEYARRYPWLEGSR